MRAWAGPALQADVARGYPWVALVGAFLLATLFQRSRVAVAAAALAGLTWVSARGGTALVAPVLGTAWALLVAALALLRDRGTLAPRAAAQWAVLVLVAALAAFVLDGGAPEITRLLDPTAPGTPSWAGLPRLQLAAYLLAALALGVALFRWRGAVERGLAWSFVSAALALHPLTTGGAPRVLLLLAAGLTLALSVVETSYAMAYRDELTGLPARRALLRDLEGLSGSYAVAMVDVDHFKKFNDRHGHDVGDQVLRMVATRIARAPGGARGYRYGGEEFTLLLPGRTREEAEPHLEAVRTAVADASFALRSWRRPRRKPDTPRKKRKGGGARRLSVTVSIGVADSGGGKRTPDEVIKRADKALYRAKRAGRNRISR